MKQFKIILPTVAEAKMFVAAASRCNFDIDVFYNRVIIDAKSILGVLIFDLSQILTVQLNGADAEFEKYLKKLAPENSSAA